MNQYVGRVRVDEDAREFAFWTYLPRSARTSRVVFRAQSGVVLSGVEVFALDRHDSDRVQQDGGAW